MNTHREPLPPAKPAKPGELPIDPHDGEIPMLGTPEEDEAHTDDAVPVVPR